MRKRPYPYRPKLFPGYIVRHWYLKQKEVLPESSSEFSTEFATEAQKAAVETLVSAINSGDNNVFGEALLPEVEGVEYKEFLGVYDVTADTGVLTLASPVKIADKYVEGAVVLHYNEELDSWENVEDVQIIDGYVWATFESLSPIAVYTYRRKMYITEANKRKYVVANGLPVKITASEKEGFVVITDIFDDTMECENNISIIGGTANEATKLEETNIVMESGVIGTLIGGSLNYEADQAYVDTVNVTVNGGEITNLVANSVHKVRVNESNIVINDGIVSYVAGGGMSSDAYKGDCNAGVGNIDSPSYTLDSNIVINGGTIEFVAGGGSSGYGYIKDATCIINGGNITAGIAAASNGVVEKFEVIVTDGNIKSLYSTNRGIVEEASFDIDGGVIDNFYLGGEPDATVTGEILAVTAEITGGSMKLHAGNNASSVIKPENDIIKAVRVTNGVDIQYIDNFYSDFASVIEVI